MSQRRIRPGQQWRVGDDAGELTVVVDGFDGSTVSASATDVHGTTQAWVKSPEALRGATLISEDGVPGWEVTAFADYSSSSIVDALLSAGQIDSTSSVAIFEDSLRGPVVRLTVVAESAEEALDRVVSALTGAGAPARAWVTAARWA